jgi:glycosyltransferase involved in cell wall biosynthesis
MAKVSVIIPTRNRAAMLRRAVDSAKKAGQSVEVIVVDDASTDDTSLVCRELTGIVYVRLPRNVGQARARNVGITKSTGEFIAFLDDDDVRIPGSLDQQSEILFRDRSLGFVYGQVEISDPTTDSLTGEIRPNTCPTGDLFWQLLKQNFIYMPSVLVRREHIFQIGLFAHDVLGTEDWDAWLRIAAIAPVGAVQESVAIYRDFSRYSGQTSSNRPKMIKASLRTQERALRLPRALDVSREQRRKLRSEFLDGSWDALIREGDISWSEGNLRYAASNYITAMRLHPARAARLGIVKRFVRSMIVPS